MPTETQFYLAIVGTLVCLLGFCKWPKSAFDLMRPRFAAPLIVWMATFYQIIWRYLRGPVHQSTLESGYRQIYGGQAEVFVICCVCAFWLGFILLRADGVAARLAQRAEISAAGGESMLRWSLALASLVALAVLVIAGPGAVLNNVGGTGSLSGSWLHFGAVAHFFAVFRKFINSLLVVLSCALLGLGWPSRGRATAGHYLLGLTVVALCSLDFIPSFSRGSGLPVVVAVASYAYRERRIPWLAAIVGAAWTLVVMDVALAGRSTVGHYAGLLPWFGVFGTVVGQLARGNLATMFNAVNGLIDAITPTAVSIAALANGHTVGRMPTLDWFAEQVPFPHFIYQGPRYTIALTRFLGGYGSWGYTSSFFGEAWIEFQWLGSLLFVVVGATLRFIDGLVFSPRRSSGRVSLYALMLPVGYIALYLGLFNNFRSWLSVTVFGFYVIFAVAYFLNTYHRGETARPAAGAGHA